MAARTPDDIKWRFMATLCKLYNKPYQGAELWTCCGAPSASDPYPDVSGLCVMVNGSIAGFWMSPSDIEDLWAS